MNYDRRDHSSRNSILANKHQERSESCVPDFQSNDNSLSLMDHSHEEIKVFLGNSALDQKQGREYARPHKRKDYYSRVSLSGKLCITSSIG